MMNATNQSNDRTASTITQDALRGAREQISIAASSAKDTALDCGSHYVTEPAKDLLGLLQGYAKSRPEVVAAWCFGLGLFLGWKLRR
jgi:hypothetical protein